MYVRSLDGEGEATYSTPRYCLILQVFVCARGKKRESGAVDGGMGKRLSRKRKH